MRETEEIFEELSGVIESLASKRHELEMYEMHLRANDPLFSRLKEARNDTQRRIEAERVFLSAPDGVWVALKAEISSLEARERILRMELDASLRADTNIYLRLSGRGDGEG